MRGVIEVGQVPADTVVGPGGLPRASSAWKPVAGRHRHPSSPSGLCGAVPASREALASPDSACGACVQPAARLGSAGTPLPAGPGLALWPKRTAWFRSRALSVFGAGPQPAFGVSLSSWGHCSPSSGYPLDSLFKAPDVAVPPPPAPMPDLTQGPVWAWPFVLVAGGAGLVPWRPLPWTVPCTQECGFSPRGSVARTHSLLCVSGPVHWALCSRPHVF